MFDSFIEGEMLIQPQIRESRLNFKDGDEWHIQLTTFGLHTSIESKWSCEFEDQGEKFTTYLFTNPFRTALFLKSCLERQHLCLGGYL